MIPARHVIYDVHFTDGTTTRIIRPHSCSLITEKSNYRDLFEIGATSVASILLENYKNELFHIQRSNIKFLRIYEATVNFDSNPLNGESYGEDEVT